MAPDTEIFFEHASLGKPLAWSTGLHVGFVALLVLSAWILPAHRGSGWGAGGGGEAIGVALVSNIPLPATQAQTQNVLANDSKGLTKSQPQQQEKEPDSIPIQDKETKNKKKPVVSAIKQNKPEPEPETNEVPYGQGGPVSGPYGSFNAGDAKGGIAVSGGGGDFGTRYGWYVQAMNRKLSENWLRYEVDRSIRSANRVYVGFTINRSGQPGEVHIEQSSGVPSLDLSATRAVQRIDTFGPLPDDYSGRTVNVEFWFDLNR